MAAKIRFEWDEDITGKTVLLALKKGKITITEIQDALMYTQGLQGNYALIIRATESMCEGSGWLDEIKPMEEVVELYPIHENEDCPICRATIPPYQYCPECGHELKEE